MITLRCPTVVHDTGFTDAPCGCGVLTSRGWRCVCCDDPVVRLSPLTVCLWFTFTTWLSRLSWETSIEPRFSRYPRLARARRFLGV